jgi:hypothetical protein
MKRRGRPSLGVDLVDSLEGPEEDLRRLKVVLETITGERTLKAASRELGVSEARFHEIRWQVLRGALDGTKPGLPGRPRTGEPAEPEEVRDLRARVKWLEEELQCAFVRTEIALVMPELLRRSEARREKKGAFTRRRKRGRDSSGGSAGT